MRKGEKLYHYLGKYFGRPLDGMALLEIEDDEFDRIIQSEIEIKNGKVIINSESD